jgi:hypothetical protein
MSYWQRINPAGAVGDFITVFRDAGKSRWKFSAVAAACVFALFSVMWQEGGTGPPPRPTVTYITTFEPGRSDAEIMASNIANQRRKDRLAAEQAKRDEEVRNIYKKLGAASGMDVAAIERKAAADRAAEARASQAAAAQVRARQEQAAVGHR